ncbi:protein trichome birefringence-like 4 [Sesamum indicum]|uniref:Protein trichome birefringence-like 4 n=1 Tax=Sesamum indicum TaxID=4182 RepID=A0A6I9UNC7_SESIN|nr:protein trichome birefringence-like 4 [Sesamum indicum]
MDSFKNLQNTLLQSSINLSRSRTDYFFTILFTLILICFFFLFSASDNTSPASRLHCSANKPPPLSSTVFPGARFASKSYRSCAVSAAFSPAETCHQIPGNAVGSASVEEETDSCDVFDGHWVVDEDFEPVYKPGSCPFIDDAFNCFKNGRPDSDYLRLKWKPHACEIPRFDGQKMLKMLTGKKMVFVGDSLNRNMWESLVCALRESLANKRNVFEVSGRRQFRNQGFYSFKFKDFNCSIDFIKSPFLVQEWKFSDKAGTRRETLRLDMMEGSYNSYHDADIIVFNTGHWWTHQKTFQGKYYFQEGNHVYRKLEVADAYKKALRTWARWVDANINSNRTRVFFRGYSSSHFKGGQWNSGGSCYGEMKPITNETHLAPYPWMMVALESVISKMKTPVFFLNITKMTDYRKDGHPSIFKQSASTIRQGMFQDCSHWCLPGVPDSWNQLLYAVLLKSHKSLGSISSY